MEEVSVPKVNVRIAPTASPHDVVILRESELGGDLTAAIERVRTDAATARSQILIIAPEPDRSNAEWAPPRPASPARGASLAALTKLGDQLTPLVDDLDQFLNENEREVGGLTETIAEGTRAQLQHRARVLHEIVAWTRAVSGDLRLLAESAQGGRAPVDLGELLAEVLADEDGKTDGVRCVLEQAETVTACVETNPTAAADLLARAARLLAARVCPGGVVAVRIESDRSVTRIAFSGRGSSRPIRGGQLVGQVRELAATLGVGIGYDPTVGPRGSSLVLSFPKVGPTLRADLSTASGLVGDARDGAATPSR